MESRAAGPFDFMMNLLLHIPHVRTETNPSPSSSLRDPASVYEGPACAIFRQQETAPGVYWRNRLSGEIPCMEFCVSEAAGTGTRSHAVCRYVVGTVPQSTPQKYARFKNNCHLVCGSHEEPQLLLGTPVPATGRCGTPWRLLEGGPAQPPSGHLPEASPHQQGKCTRLTGQGGDRQN